MLNSITFSALVALSLSPMIQAAPVSVGSGISFNKRDGFSGEGTYYDPGLGSCEVTSGPNELIAALNIVQFGSYPRPSNSPACFSCAMVHGPLGSVKVKIVDMCPGCKSGDLDLSPAAFDQVAKKEQGRIPITWEYVSCNGGDPQPPKPEKPTKTTALPETTETEKPTSTIKPKPTPTESVTPTATSKPKPTQTKVSKRISSTVYKKPIPTDEPKPSGVCDFSGRRCVSSEESSGFESCVHGKLFKQRCAHGTVCKTEYGDISCTWA
ncbi:hypothetical protein K7432_011417 [Basidiobolus ranarum]|uniref:RlpA-like protein double-psi beta-barrel domain-containing protein n=1 Tax=Basidiobolus ranarum TaxID=34480 RepID=A0ABR2VTV7_9FUNG